MQCLWSGLLPTEHLGVWEGGIFEMTEGYGRLGIGAKRSAPHQMVRCGLFFNTQERYSVHPRNFSSTLCAYMYFVENFMLLLSVSSKSIKIMIPPINVCSK